jgi:hypothetical protein
VILSFAISFVFILYVFCTGSVVKKSPDKFSGKV